VADFPESERLIRDMAREFVGFRIVAKRESLLSKLIDVGLKLVTFGGQRDYLSRYHTVLGNTLYTPESWEGTPDLERLITLRHERVHLRQRRRLTFPVMAFLYMIPLFPVGLAYGRARLEWEAYEETLAATAELKGLEALREPSLREHIVRRFTGADYGWMWPFRSVIERWYDEAIERIEATLTQPVADETPARRTPGPLA
jgi:hypothetical protein